MGEILRAAAALPRAGACGEERGGDAAAREWGGGAGLCVSSSAAPAAGLRPPASWAARRGLAAEEWVHVMAGP